MPSVQTPEIRNGRVLTMVKIGTKVIVGGSFSQVANRNGGTAYARNNIFAFDATTGFVDTTFAPTVNGVVNALLPGTGSTVYAGGTFTTVNGATHRNLTLLNSGNGSLAAGFKAATLNGAVNDLALSGGRLFVGGTFSTAGAVGHGGFATLNPTTGGVDAYMTIDVAVNHNYNGTGARAAIGVSKLDISPDGTRLAAIGNFKLVEGQSRDQAVVVLLQPGGPVVDPNWRTTRYEPACSRNAFDTYVRDLDFAPDGAYFSIVATGGPHPGTLCDTATRWEVADTGQDVQPRWIADTGGDTLFSVAITGTAVYVGGHQRWMNNAGGKDTPAPGAVPRPGLAALDPLNGVPLSWNPGRHPRGVGAQALLATPEGLYVGSDTQYIGNFQYLRPRIAFFPLAGGTPPAAQDTGTLPANVFLAGRPIATVGGPGVNDVVKRFYDGSTTSPSSTLPTAGIDWSRARGAFMAGGKVVYGWSDGNLYTRTFDGTSFGPAILIDPYNDPVWSTVKHGSGTTGQTYRGVKPNFYGQLPNVTGMFYSGGRVYYTQAGQQALFYRGMSLDSLIVAPNPDQRTVPGSTGWADVQGMFVSGSSLYWASRIDGNLRRIAFIDGAPTGLAKVVSGPLVDGNDWRTRAMFLGPGGPSANQEIAFRAAATPFDASGVSAALVTVPSSVESGDALVLVLSTSSAVTGDVPQGYTAVGTQTAATAVTTQVWQKVAGEADAGSTVTVNLSGRAKATLTLVAYSGTAQNSPVLSFTGASDTGGTSHTTPTATAPADALVV
ncbi:MAG: hypothetical protein M3500_14350, partial [Actinomycetota bacterium]|nr:hypothetical protein [Actinomycetota bacterium]